MNLNKFYKNILKLFDIIFLIFLHYRLNIYFHIFILIEFD